jgi:hypothetical protein
MAIKKHIHKSKIHITIKKKISKATKRFLKYSKKLRNHRKTKSRNNHNNKSKNKTNMKGGFSGCGIATINEPGFSIPALGAIDGMSIPDTRSAIYRPSCTASSNQAMVNP